MVQYLCNVDITISPSNDETARSHGHNIDSTIISCKVEEENITEWLESVGKPDAVVSDRADYSRRDGAACPGDHDESNSDLNGSLNESDEEDDDSHLGDGVLVVQVEGAGISQVNGILHPGPCVGLCRSLYQDRSVGKH